MTPFSAAAADDTILLWVPEATQTFTEQQIEAFKEANPDYAAHRAAIVCYALPVRNNADDPWQEQMTGGSRPRCCDENRTDRKEKTDGKKHRKPI